MRHPSPPPVWLCVDGVVTLCVCVCVCVGRSLAKSSDRKLLKGFRKISELVGLLSAPQTVVDAAQLVFKRALDTQSLKGRSVNAIVAACVYIGCRQEDLGRSLKEVCARTNVAFTDISRVYTVHSLPLTHCHSLPLTPTHSLSCWLLLLSDRKFFAC